ncbi:MAG: phosphatidate cytidylyltransferase [Oscillospiraceae bacterium]
MLKTRVKTAAVLTVIVLVVLYFSYIPGVINVAAAFLGMVAVWEIYTVCGVKKKSIGFVAALLLAGVCPFLPDRYYTAAVAVLFPLGVLWFALEARDLTHFMLPENLTAFVMSVIVAAFFKAVPVLRGGEFGLVYLLLAVVVCTATDTAAYFTGRAFGRHKLAPRISPGKSREGAVGGTVAAVLLAVLFCWIVSAVGYGRARYGVVLLYAVTASVVGQVGDLSLSVIKRIAGVKDYGKLMPGHGGVLDRFDSILFVFPYTILFLCLLPILTAGV